MSTTMTTSPLGLLALAAIIAAGPCPVAALLALR